MQIKTKVLTTTSSQGLSTTQQGNARTNINAQKTLAADEDSHISLTDGTDESGNPVTKIAVSGTFGKVYTAEDPNYIEVDNNADTIALSSKAKAKIDAPCSVATADPVYGDGTVSNPINVKTMIGSYDASTFEEDKEYNISVDGKVYSIVRIGSVLWMTLNWSDPSASEVYYPNNDIAMVPTYGYLYRYASVAKMTFPTGWRLPTGDDVVALFEHFNFTQYTSNTWQAGIYTIDGVDYESWEAIHKIMKYTNSGGVIGISAGTGNVENFQYESRFWAQGCIDYANMYGAKYGYYPGENHTDRAYSVRLCRSLTGTAGLPPVPSDGDQNKFLRGDGTWATAGISGLEGDQYINVSGSKISANVATAEETANIFDEE